MAQVGRGSKTSTFRESARNACLRYAAALQLTRSIRPEQRSEIDDWLSDIDRLSSLQLRSQWKRIARHVDVTFRWFGVRGSLDELQNLVASAEKNPEQVSYVRKAEIARLFTHYERALHVFPKLPPHAFIGLDVNGLLGEISWHLLEAALFEDVAALWNAAFAVRDHVFPAAAQDVKEAVAFQRATLKAAFNLLEGYVNGIAADCLLIYDNDLTANERVQLLEFDEGNHCRKYLSLRDKLLQYPKIAARASVPPVQENSCVEMRGLLALEDPIRHGLIHPDSRIPGRDVPFMRPDIDMVEAVVDDTTELIRVIASFLPQPFGDVAVWLRSRESDGAFSPSVFA